ncbi:hypothetical protein HDV00_003988 [Rhizophlyctis rosea]|nr:hypothetical protein HDV00_003988 [Rhizophlyctis rosea]
MHLAQICKLWRHVAFRLRDGDTLNPTPHLYPLIIVGEPLEVLEKLTRGQELLHADPLRVEAARKLVLRDYNDTDAPEWEQLLRKVNFTKIQSLDVGGDADSLYLPHLIDGFKSTQDNIRLRKFRIALSAYDSAEMSPVINELLATFHDAPLSSIDLVARPSNVLRQLQPIPELPVNIRMKPTNFLKHIRIAGNIRMENLASFAPRLEYIRIQYLSQSIADFDQLSQLTQASVERLELAGSGWEKAVKSIPVDTLLQLKKVSISGYSRHTIDVDDFIGHLKNLTGLVDLDMWPKKFGDIKLPIKGLPSFSERVPCKNTLRRLVLRTDGWDLDSVLRALAFLPHLKHFVLETDIVVPDNEAAAVVEMGKGRGMKVDIHRTESTMAAMFAQYQMY